MSNSDKCSIWIGYDPREINAFEVARSSLLRRMSRCIPVHKLSLGELQQRGLYTRPTSRRKGALIDELSVTQGYDGRISTEHACARFWVPELAGEGWALFMDGDILVRADIAQVFKNLDRSKALYCVKHNYVPMDIVKKGGDLQTYYARKNWSSFMIFNCEHPSNGWLTRQMLNTRPGRDLHAFCWLHDDEIGALDLRWNWLVGVSDPGINPAVCHFTEGCPDIPGFEGVPFADEWRAELAAVKVVPA